MSGSINFDGDTAARCFVNTAVVTAPPFTIVYWGKPNATLSRNHAGAGLFSSTTSLDNSHYTLHSSASGNHTAYSRISNNIGSGFASGTTLDAWNHYAAKWVATDERSVLIDGGGKSTGTDLVEPSAPSLLFIGNRPATTPSSSYEGLLSHIAIWNVALSDAQIEELAGGENPQSVESGALVAYYPGDTFDDGGSTFLEDVSSAGNHAELLDGAVWNADEPVVSEPPSVSGNVYVTVPDMYEEGLLPGSISVDAEGFDNESASQTPDLIPPTNHIVINSLSGFDALENPNKSFAKDGGSDGMGLSVIDEEGIIDSLGNDGVPTFVAGVDFPQTLQRSLYDNGAWSTFEEVTVSEEELTLVADAGPDRTKLIGQQITLDGTGTTSQGDIEQVLWQVISAPPGGAWSFIGEDSLQPEFVVLNATGVYTVQLQVSDVYGQTSTDQMQVTVEQMMGNYQIRRRGGNATAHNAFTGAERELTVDTTNWNIRVHDGSTTGGVPTVMLMSGVSGDRPTNVMVGQPYFDTTLGYPVWWDGDDWVDSSGTSV